MTSKIKRPNQAPKHSVASTTADIGAYATAEALATGLEVATYVGIALVDDKINALPTETTNLADDLNGAAFQTGGSFGGEAPVTGGSISDAAAEGSMFDSLNGLGDQVGDWAGSAFEGLSEVAGSAGEIAGSVAEGAADVAGEIIGGILSGIG